MPQYREGWQDVRRKQRPLVLLSAMVLALFASMSVHASLTLHAPDQVDLDQQFKVSIPEQTSAVEWSWNHSIFRLEKGVGNETEKIFKAIQTGIGTLTVRCCGAQVSAQILVNGKHQGKKTRPDPNKLKTETPKIRAARDLLNNAISSRPTMEEMAFFREMAKQGLTIRDLYEAKGEIVKLKFRELRAQGVENNKAMAQAHLSWNATYAEYEQSLMMARKNAVQEAWSSALREYVKTHPNETYIGAKMDVGGWASERRNDMRFEGDIDFSILHVEVSEASKLRDMFDNHLAKMTGLDMGQIDAIATAHRNAKLSVYIGDYGAKWAEIDVIRRGKMYKLKVVDGKIISTPMTFDEKMVFLAVLENNVAKQKTGVDILDKILLEGEPRPKSSMEPGVSLEFLRHITGDAINANLTYLEKIIKIAKYVDRSAKDHAGFLSEVEGFAMVAFDQHLVRAVAQIIQIKKRKAESLEEKSAKIGDIIHVASQLMGGEWLINPEAALQSLGKRAERLLEHNVTEGIRARQLMIENIKDPVRQIEAENKLLDDLKNEYQVFEHEHVKFPRTALQSLQQIITSNINKRLRRIHNSTEPRLTEQLKNQLLSDLTNLFNTFIHEPSSFPKYAINVMKSLAKDRSNLLLSAKKIGIIKEVLREAAKRKSSAELITGIIWRGLLGVHGRANAAADTTNYILDFMDNTTLGRLREYHILEGQRTPDGRFRVSNPINLNTINSRLNKTFLGTVGNSLSFKGINLYSEGKEYYEALVNADTWKEGVLNLSWRFFERRAPAYQVMRAYYQDVTRLRVLTEVAYVLFPPLAIPEAVAGLVQSANNWTWQLYDQYRYQGLVEELYQGASFSKDPTTYRWKLQKVSYHCPSGKLVRLSRENFAAIVKQCHSVQISLYGQIKENPVLKEFERTLAHPAISDGATSFIVYPYYYNNLSKYGKMIQKQYHHKVDEEVAAYLTELIGKLEERKEFTTDLRIAKLYDLQKRYVCANPLLELSGSTSKGEQNKLEQLFQYDQQIIRANASISNLRSQWDIDYIQALKPVCAVQSFAAMASKAEKLVLSLRQRLALIKKQVMEIIGRDNMTKGLLQPLVFTGLHLPLYSNSSHQYARWYGEYEHALDRLRGLKIPLKVEITGPGKACLGQNVEFLTQYNKPPCAKCEARWSVARGARQRTNLQDGTLKRLQWVPSTAGEATILLGVYRSNQLQASARLAVTVVTEQSSGCKPLAIRLIAASEQIPLGQVMAVKVEPLSLGPEQSPLVRYFWSENNGPVQSAADDTYQLDSGKYHAGERITLTVAARTKSHKLVVATKQFVVIQPSQQSLVVNIAPKLTRIVGNRAVRLVAMASRTRSLGTQLHYEWQVNDRAVSDGMAFEFNPGKYSRLVKISVKVDELQLPGQEQSGRRPGSPVASGTTSMTVRLLNTGLLAVNLATYPTRVLDDHDIRICVIPPGSGAQDVIYYYAEKTSNGWMRDHPFEQHHCMLFSPRGRSGQHLQFRIQARDHLGRFGEAETAVIDVVSATTEVNPTQANSPTPIKPDGPAEQDANNKSTPQKTIEHKPQKDHSSNKSDAHTTDITDGQGGQKTKTTEQSTIKAPSQVVAGNVFSVSVEPLKALKDKARYYFWNGPRLTPRNWKENKYDPATMKMLVHPRDAFPTELNIKNGVATSVSVSLLDAPGKNIGDAQLDIPVRLVQLGVKLPAGWRGGPGLDGFGANQYAGERWQSYSGRFTLHWIRGRDSIPDDYKEAVTIGEFKGFGKLKPLAFDSGYGGMMGYHASSAIQTLNAIVEKNGLQLEVYVLGGAGGYWDNRNADWVKAKGAAMFKESMALANAAAHIRPYKSKLPIIDISKYQVVLPLTVSLRGPKTTLAVGAKARIVAQVNGGTAPYSYTWAGEVAGHSQRVDFVGKRPGDHVISVAVADSKGRKASGSIKLAVKVPVYEVHGLPAKPFYGSTAALSVVAKGNTAGNWQPVWQASQPGVEFDPPEGTQTHVTFGRMGKIAVWVQVPRTDGGKTLESKQQYANVISPGFTLHLSPDKPSVGQQVRATITSKPKLSDTMVRWVWSSPISANRIEYNDPASAIGFVLKDANPFALKAEAVVPYYGDVIGMIAGSIQAKKYSLKITEQKIGPPVLTWDPVKKGLVEAAANTYLTGQEISLSALIEGEPKPVDVRWKWKVNEGTNITNAYVQQPVVSRSTAGIINAEVVATDKNKIVLGRGSITISVSEPVREPLQGEKGKQTDKTGSSAVGAIPGTGNLPGSAKTRGESGGQISASSKSSPIAKQSASGTDQHGTQEPPDSRNTAVSNIPRHDGKKSEKPVSSTRDNDAIRRAKAARKKAEEQAKKHMSTTLVKKAHKSHTGPESAGRKMAATSRGNTLTLEKAIFAPNEEIHLKFQRSPQLPNNSWVGLIPSKVKHGSTRSNDQADLAYEYIKERSSGEMLFHAPAKAGKYDLRLSETDHDKEITSVSFIVEVPKAGAAIILSKSTFAPKEKISLKFKASTLLSKGAWVGLIPSKVPHGSTTRNDNADVAYQYVDGQASGTMVFTAPSKEGQYDFRMSEDTNDKEITSVSFAVAVPEVGAAIILPKTTFAPKEQISLKYKASTLLPKGTWVGLIPSKVQHGSTARNDKADVAYQYVDGQASGTMVFTAPSKEGQYDFRMSEDTNDKEITSVSFTVSRKPAIQGQRDFSGNSKKSATPGSLTAKIDNKGSVENEPRKASVFTFESPVTLLFISTYHWNYGHGTTLPGTISLRDTSGKIFGPWQTHGRAGQGGVQNANWDANPNVQLQPGTYTVIDSDSATWSTNAAEGWRGFVTIRTAVPDYSDVNMPANTQRRKSMASGITEAPASRYKLVLSSGIRWEDARREAEKMGGHLAVITSAAENAIVAKVAMSDDRAWSLDRYRNGIGPWLGGSRSSPPNSWSWVTGEKWGYTNWSPGEPNNSNSNENHIQFFGHGTLKSPQWNDISGQAMLKGFVVELAESKPEG